MKYKAFFAALLAAVLLISLAACTGTATVEVTPSAQTEAPAAPAAPQPAPAAQQPQEPQKEETAWTLDPAGLTDAYIVETIIRLPELALSGEAFTFDAPKDLTSRQLYLLFAAWAEPEELAACYDKAKDVYVFDADTICRTLDRYLEGYSLNITECPLYDAGRGAVVTPVAGGFGGDLTVTLESKTYDGNTAVFAALLAGSGEKEYTVEFYDGGYRYVSVRQLRAEAARTAVGSLTLDGVSYDAYADVSEQEICFWDAASGGRLLAVARYPETLTGAKEALTGCDLTDLDADGCSDLSAEFSFPDGSSASLLWFYSGGSFVYNAEFSILPGEQNAAGES